MLEVLIFLCFVFSGRVDEKKITLDDQALDIYTDIKRENLKISYVVDDDGTEKHLECAPVKKEFVNDLHAFECDVYSFSIPLSDLKEILFEIIDDKKSSQPKYIHLSKLKI